ncbi:hypothetical protein M0802_015043 [Mischocyttarus mexicanus]|nr:hypothetical protein M0802_015043 [Mischocyttarus mexicanus]
MDQPAAAAAAWTHIYTSPTKLSVAISIQWLLWFFDLKRNTGALGWRPGYAALILKCFERCSSITTTTTTTTNYLQSRSIPILVLPYFSCTKGLSLPFVRRFKKPAAGVRKNGMSKMPQGKGRSSNMKMIKTRRILGDFRMKRTNTIKDVT